MEQFIESTKAPYLGAIVPHTGGVSTVEVLGRDLWLVTTTPQESRRVLLLPDVTPLDIDVLVEALGVIAQKLDALLAQRHAARAPRSERPR